MADHPSINEARGFCQTQIQKLLDRVTVHPNIIQCSVLPYSLVHLQGVYHSATYRIEDVYAAIRVASLNSELPGAAVIWAELDESKEVHHEKNH